MSRLCVLFDVVCVVCVAGACCVDRCAECVCACGICLLLLTLGAPCSFSTFFSISVATNVTARDARVTS